MKPTRQQIEEDVKRLAAEQYYGEFSSIECSSKLIEDLGFDSLDCVEFLINLEELYSIEISDEQAESCDTVEDFIKLVESKFQ